MLGLKYCSEHQMDVVGTGFTVLDRVYSDGDLAHEALGGSCGNVLISLAMLNRNVAPVLALGDDNAGRRLVDEFSHAGATVRYITRHSEIRSPILAQSLDTKSGQHNFSFVCPDTFERLPRYQPICETELVSALPVLSLCSVFYTDRLSVSILEAMRTAEAAGSIIYFEPSDCDESELFEEALQLATILKYSQDRLDKRLAERLTDCIRIVTYGASGLEVHDGSETIWCDAIDAPNVLDTCGSGDMVSVGVIDWMLTNRFDLTRMNTADLLEGVVAGQRLAAENCGYTGARGVFEGRGASYVRGLLSDRSAAD